MVKLFSLFLVLALAFPVLAQTTTDSFRDQLQGTREEVRGEIRDVRDEFQQSTTDARENLQSDVTAIRDQARILREGDTEAFRAKQEEFAEGIRQAKDNFRSTLEAKRAELKGRIDAKRAELKERLRQIKDERKRLAVERIDQRIDALNERVLSHYTDVLEKIEEALSRVSSRSDKAEVNGLDVSAVRPMISEAESVIAASRSAIELQADKTYSIEINEEDTLRIDVGETRKAVHADLSNVRDTVRSAHDAVRRVAVALAQIPKVDELEVELNEEDEGSSLEQ